MGHADDELLDAGGGGPVDDLLDGGDEDLAALQPEPLLTWPLAGQELLEVGRADQPLEQDLTAGRSFDTCHQVGQWQGSHLLLVGRKLLNMGKFEAAAEPVLLVSIGYVHVLHADVMTVGPLQGDGVSFKRARNA